MRGECCFLELSRGPAVLLCWTLSPGPPCSSRSQPLAYPGDPPTAWVRSGPGAPASEAPAHLTAGPAFSGLQVASAFSGLPCLRAEGCVAVGTLAAVSQRSPLFHARGAPTLLLGRLLSTTREKQPRDLPGQLLASLCPHVPWHTLPLHPYFAGSIQATWPSRV